MIGLFHGKGEIEDVLNAMPLNKMDFKRGAEFDGAMGIYDKVFGPTKGGPMSRAMDMTTNLLTVGHRITTGLSRQFFFEQRLRSNLEGMGKTVQDLLDEANSPNGFSEPMTSAISDSFGHMMKQTFQYVPKHGFTANVLKAYKAFGPLATMIGPTFPRFLMNTFRYQWENSPVGLVGLFSKDFRSQLADGGLGGRMAARQLGQGVAGALTLAGAWTIRNSEMAGPKYYQVSSGKAPDGNLQFVDGRAWAPAVPYLFMADLMKHVVTGQPMNLTPSEWSDAILHVRSLSQTPIFAIQEGIAQLAGKIGHESDLPPALKSIVGDYVSSYFRPIKTLGELYGTVDKSVLERRDTRGQEVLGPTIASIPPLAKTLPAQVSPFTGAPVAEQHPIEHGLFGIDHVNMTPLEKLVYDTPGTNPYTLIGQHTNETAKNLVATEMGKILQTGGLGNQIADVLGKMPVAERKMYLQEIFTEIRIQATPAAMAKNPRAFIGDILRSLPADLATEVEKSLTPAPRKP
jgi:hypothetical protein